MLEDLRAEGYDAVVLDFTEATEPIQRNAFVLTELLAQVAADGPGPSTGVVGASMGGLVARYALTWLENQGARPPGAHLPELRLAARRGQHPPGPAALAGLLPDRVGRGGLPAVAPGHPGARQMLLYHHLATSGTAGADPAARGLAGRPGRHRRLAAGAPPGGRGQRQRRRADQGFAAGDQIIPYEYRSLLVDIDGDVWAVPDGGPAQIIFDGGINLIWPLPDTYRTVSVGGTLPWDAAPGGYRGSMAQMDATTAPYGDIVALHDNHCFMPTVSALALRGRPAVPRHRRRPGPAEPHRL